MEPRATVTVVEHPLVARHLTVLRDRATPSDAFRAALAEVTTFVGYEALRDLRTRAEDVETPLETTTGARLADEIVVIAILRAGLGMVDGFLRLVPEARVGHLGIYRDEASASPVGYYESLPRHGPGAEVVLVDPSSRRAAARSTRSAGSGRRALRASASSAWSRRPRASRRSTPPTRTSRSPARPSTASSTTRPTSVPGSATGDRLFGT